MLSRWLIIMLASEIFETFFFDEYNITKFLDRYANLCLNYDFEKKEKIRRLLRYCDFINEQYIQVVINANVFHWKKLCKTFCKNYKNKKLDQQLHFLKYLEIFKNKMRTSLKEISQYCRQYTIISKKLIKTRKFQRILRNAWFLQKLLEKFNEKLAIRCFLNEDDEKKMRFETLVKQILQLAKSWIVIIKTRKIEYKMKRTTTLIKKMKSIINKNVNKHFINLLKTMKFRDESSISNVDVKLDNLTEIMRKMTMNVDNLINCVFSRVNEEIQSRVKIINRICSRVIFLRINRLCSARNHSRSLFKICFLRIYHFRLCHFWTMKLRVRLLLNVFIAIKRIICTKKNVLNLIKIWELKKFICKKKELISTFIILISFTFEWFFTKVNDNVSRMQRS
jgi:hypothetical protein